MGEDRVLALLEAIDWNDIILKLTYYAAMRFKRYAWRSNLPKGISPEDVALNAIAKVWDGTRDWDPEKYPDLLAHLKWIVKSDVHHLFCSLEHKTTGRKPMITQENGNEVEFEEPTSEDPHSISAKVLKPDDELIAKQQREYEEALLRLLHDAVKGDEDLELLMMCFEDNIDKPEAIAAEIGWDIDKVYNLKRKLLRKAAKIGERISTEEG